MGVDRLRVRFRAEATALGGGEATPCSPADDCRRRSEVWAMREGWNNVSFVRDSRMPLSTASLALLGLRRHDELVSRAHEWCTRRQGKSANPASVAMARADGCANPQILRHEGEAQRGIGACEGVKDLMVCFKDLLDEPSADRATVLFERVRAFEDWSVSDLEGYTWFMTDKRPTLVGRQPG